MLDVKPGVYRGEPVASASFAPNAWGLYDMHGNVAEWVWERYGTIYLGYPNWWASIPMPIATFLESYDFAGKTIRPFCSNGGGGLGQSVTAISKLAPSAHVGRGLSIYYSGGSDLPQVVADWIAQDD